MSRPYIKSKDLETLLLMLLLPKRWLSDEISCLLRPFAFLFCSKIPLTVLSGQSVNNHNANFQGYTQVRLH